MPRQPQTVNASEHAAPKVYAPIAGGPPPSPPGSAGAYGDDRGDHIHAGNDVATPTGTACVAPVDGTVTDMGPFDGGNMAHFKFDEDCGSIRAGEIIGFGHAQADSIKSGQARAGDTVALSNHPAPHVHFVYIIPGHGGNGVDGNTDPYDIYNFLRKGQAPTGAAPPASGGGASSANAGFTQEDLYAVGRASAMSTSFELPGLTSSLESNLMQGAKSIYNDEPLMPFVEQLCKASLRQFQSLPNGAFFAFFPDQFGLYGHRKPYWSISNVEIVDGQISLNDESLATHVFVVGDTSGLYGGDGAISLAERMMSHGVVTIFDAFASKFMIHKATDEENDPKKAEEEAAIRKTKEYQNALNFLRKYGVRPHYEEALFIRNSFFEIFYAFTQFQLLWASQFVTDFTFTFMPELYPGGIVALEDHGIQCYIDSVTHTFDYEGGFHTQAALSSPSALSKSDTPVSQGMAQPFSKGFEGSIAGGLPSGTGR